MPIKIKATGEYVGATSHSHVIRALAQQHARTATAAVAAPTDNSGGTPAAAITLLSPVVGAAASGSNLAGKTTTDAELVKVRDAIKELVAKGNALATIVGAGTITDSLGGTAADGTIGAIASSVTGAATGAPVAAVNTFLSAVNNTTVSLVKQANEVAAAVGATPLTISGLVDGTYLTTFPAMAVDSGTAVDPGTTKAEFDAALVAIKNTVASIAAVHIAACTAGSPLVVAGT